NILIHRDGRAMVADFGLVQDAGDPGLSLTGEPLGTPYYMSPEQASLSSAERVDERSDVYSLGVTLYECLTGRRPFEGETALAVLEAIRFGSVPPLRSRAPRSSRAAEAVVRRAMARRKEDRYPTAIDLAADLGALAAGRPTQAMVQAGGLLRRCVAGMRDVLSGHGVEYESPRRFLGLPLVHVNYRLRRPGISVRRARGWLAMSDVALGGIAIGPFSCGIVSLGSVALGGVSIAGLALGGYAFGGLAAGLFATGGLAVGYAAAGGAAIGRFAAGGWAFGAHVCRQVAGRRVLDEAALEVFATFMPWVGWLFGR
ncbi:MAG: serine/threonine protein kinase, partial [Planctomycetes bacterium]|nr:serine/threonine protein kinase [Planctomycetota bacterium]